MLTFFFPLSTLKMLLHRLPTCTVSDNKSVAILTCISIFVMCLFFFKCFLVFLLITDYKQLDYDID